MNAAHGICVSHNFETAHRLFTVPGKCQNLHGHSWQVELTIVGAGLDGREMLIEYGELKRSFRGWIDDNLDHGAMLHVGDPLLPVFKELGMKYYPFDSNPTVEAVAAEIAEVVGEQILPFCENGENCRLVAVKVKETSTNAACWFADE